MIDARETAKALCLAVSLSVIGAGIGLSSWFFGAALARWWSPCC